MSEEKDNKATPKTARIIFGIVMIVIYVGMGALVLSGYFYWMHDWLRIPGGILFIVYGLWRAFRLYKGVETRF